MMEPLQSLVSQMDRMEATLSQFDTNNAAAIVGSRSPCGRLFFTPGLKILYHHEARQIPETMKQEALQLEPVLGSYGAYKFSHTFHMEKPFNYSPLKLPS